MKKALLLSLLCLKALLSIAQTSTPLISSGDIWRYSDKGTTPVSQTVGPAVYSWNAVEYNDSSPASWSAGPSELGYGDGGESTTVAAGPSGNQFITTYFRKSFINSAILTHYRYKVRFKRDDGIIIYLNGIEVRRDGMPSGTVTNSTPATLTVGGADESTWYEFYLPNGAVRQGANVMAAEVHQIGPTSSDISFDLELLGESISNSLLATSLPLTSATTTNWKYSDAGIDRGTSWRTASYDDQYWQQTNIGSAARDRMGYGETTDPNTGAINTDIADPFHCNTYNNYVSFGISPTSKFPTTYFRKKVNIPNVAANAGYELRFKRDDGILIYINGVELPRDANGNTNNMTGTVSYTTLASSDATNETAWSAWQPVSSSLLVNGDNQIGVEIHQATLGSSDITFNLEMRVQGAPQIIRGPYLQLGTQTAATIRWRTDVPVLGRVTYGTSASTVSETSATTEHEIRITNLTPDRQYSYSIGTTTQVLEYGPDYYFMTAPLSDTKRKIRIASFGDCGTNASTVSVDNQTKVRDGFLAYRGNTPTDLWMLIGDNSYDGDDNQYQTNFFTPYRTNLLRNSMMFAVPGNHDYNNNLALAASHAIPYYTMFSFPTAGEAGGVASGTEEWYSFDYGPVHFVMLDSYGSRSISGNDRRMYDDTLNHPQIQWLKTDLAATTRKWKIVYMHFPPYTKGSHDSEPTNTASGDYRDLDPIRRQINPILERFGVDMVLTGHSHGYERSYPIHSLTATMSAFAADSSAFMFPDDLGSGRYDGSWKSCAYKSTSEKKKQGTVYVVTGSAGALDNSTRPVHEIMATGTNIRNKGGSFYMEVEDNRLDARFLQTTDTYSYSITDQFTIMKDVDVVQTLTLTAGQSVTLTASFISDYVWTSPGNATFTAPASRTLVVSPTTSQTFVVKDSKQCIQDVFNVQINCAGPLFSVKSGNWDDPTVWSCNRIPLSTDIVQVKHLISVPANLQARALKVQFDPNTKLTYGSNARLLLSQ